jgi:hypothetical protein
MYGLRLDLLVKNFANEGEIISIVAIQFFSNWLKMQSKKLDCKVSVSRKRLAKLKRIIPVKIKSNITSFLWHNFSKSQTTDENSGISSEIKIQNATKNLAVGMPSGHQHLKFRECKCYSLHDAVVEANGKMLCHLFPSNANSVKIPIVIQNFNENK